MKALGGEWNLDRGAGVGSLHESSGTRDCVLRTGGLEANGEASASVCTQHLPALRLGQLAGSLQKR